MSGYGHDEAMRDLFTLLPDDPESYARANVERYITRLEADLEAEREVSATYARVGDEMQERGERLVAQLRADLEAKTRLVEAVTRYRESPYSADRAACLMGIYAAHDAVMKEVEG